MRHGPTRSRRPDKGKPEPPAAAVTGGLPAGFRPLAARRNGDDLAELTRRIEAGDVTPVIDRTYDLADAADAIRQFEAGAVRGKLVLTV